MMSANLKQSLFKVFSSQELFDQKTSKDIISRRIITSKKILFKVSAFHIAGSVEGEGGGVDVACGRSSTI